MKKTLTYVLLSCSLLVASMAGCTKSQNTSLASFQPEIANVADNFQLQATNVTQVTTTIDYDWSNSGTMATIDKSGVLTAGTAKISLLDKNGTTVATSDLKVTGNETSSTGVSGIWKIRLELNQFNGTLNFRVQKK